MSIEATTGSIALQAREYLASPFTQSAVKINSKTPYDKAEKNVEDKVYSRSYFNVKPQAKLQYSAPEVAPNETSLKIDTEIKGFSKSGLSSKDIVNQSLKQGYSANQAVNIANAQAAYLRSAFLTSDPVGVLSTCSYTIS